MIVIKQWQEDREGTEKRMASVLCSLSLSLLLHIHAFISLENNRRSCVRLCTSFGDFWSWVLYAKSWWLTEWFAMMSDSGVVYKNSTGLSTEPYRTPNMRGEVEKDELLTTTHWFLPRRWSKPLESSRADANGSFETGKKNLVINSIKCSWKIQQE